MTNYNLNYSHALQPTSGWDLIEHLDFAAPLTSAAKNFDNGSNCFAGIPAGSVLSVNSSGKLVTGCVGSAMPLFLPKSTWDPDANVDYFTPDGTNVAGIGMNSFADYSDVLARSGSATNLTKSASSWSLTADYAKIRVYPATCAMEMATTEFDYDASNLNSTFAPGTKLTSPAAENPVTTTGTTAADYQARRGGYLKAATSGDAVCGVVSRGIAVNEHGVQVLYFWPVYQAATTI